MIYLPSFAMAWGSKVSSRVREIAELRGWHVISVNQPQHLFRKSIDRKHSRVADPRDPWWATLANRASVLEADHFRNGVAATPDEAVLAALPSDLRAALRRCEKAVDSLRDCLQK